MEIYYVKCKVSQSLHNDHQISVEGAIAACWIKTNSLESARLKAEFFIEKDGWIINKFEVTYPVTREMFLGKDGLAHFDQAIKNDYSILYIAWDSKVTEETTFELRVKNKIDKTKLYKQRKKILKKECCLHFNNGDDCDHIIKAHSIQKNQSLTSIAIDGHVYQLHCKPLLNIFYSLEGINKVSTFKGFCKKHDDILFKPIDTSPLIPNSEQIFLYAYRSICKELFEKSKVLELYISQLDSFTEECSESKKVQVLIEGTILGLNQLNIIKNAYDHTIRNKTFSDIKSIVFESQKEPIIAFSGLIYPQYDFQGNTLQDLSNINNNLSLLTFCSAPMKNGWGLILAWHQENSEACDRFIASLSQHVEEEGVLGDALFRFVISSCENHAFSPLWWDSLANSYKERILDRIKEMYDPMSIIQPTYLKFGLEEICKWDFQNFYTNLEPVS